MPLNVGPVKVPAVCPMEAVLMEATAPELAMEAEAPAPLSVPETPSVPKVVTEDLFVAVCPMVEKPDIGAKVPLRSIAVPLREEIAPVDPIEAEAAEPPSEATVIDPLVWTGAAEAEPPLVWPLMADCVRAGVPSPSVVAVGEDAVAVLESDATAPLAFTEADAASPDRALPLSVPLSVP